MHAHRYYRLHFLRSTPEPPFQREAMVGLAVHVIRGVLLGVTGF
jgi:hypothetical protein